MNKTRTFSLLVAASAALTLMPLSARAQIPQYALIPQATWDCGMPDGIPSPELGRLIFEMEIPLDRAVDIGNTQYGFAARGRRARRFRQRGRVVGST